MKSLRKVVVCIITAMILVSAVPFMQFNKGNGVEAATGQEIVNDANSWIGYTQYVWGGTNLNTGCDCSGFVCAIFKRHGLDFISTYGIRTSYDMYNYISKYGKKVGNTAAAMKDGYIIIFYTSAGNTGHVGICATDKNGNKEVIHAAGTGKGIRRDSISYLTGGPRGMGIAAIVKPYVINGKVYNNVTRGGKGDAQDDDSGKDDAETAKEEAEAKKKNPGYPYDLQTAAIKKKNNNGVMWLQMALNNVHMTNLEVDGWFGPKTKAAVKSFQKANGLKANGKATKATVLKLTSLHIINQAITKVSLDEIDDIIEVGQTVKLNAVITPETSSSAKLVWKTSKKRVAKVSADGIVTARHEGTVKISVTSPNGIKVIKELEVIPSDHYGEWYNGRYYNKDGTPNYKKSGTWQKTKKKKWFGNDSWRAKDEWLTIDGKTYYFNSKGYVLSKGWHVIGNNEYYIEKGGYRLENQFIAGRRLSSDGSWKNKSTAFWTKTEEGWMYKDTSGWFARMGTVKIDGRKYSFDKDGNCQNK